MRFLSDNRKRSLCFCFLSLDRIRILSFLTLVFSTLPRFDHESTMYTHNMKSSGACVRLAEEQDISLDALTFEQLQNIDSRFEEDVMKVWDYEMSVERKSSIGGTSKARVLEQIEKCLAYAKTL